MPPDPPGFAEFAGRARQVRLVREPSDQVDASYFTIDEVEVPEPSVGEVLVRNLNMSVDPYMMSRLNGVEGAAAAYQVGQPLDGEAIGVVVASSEPAVTPGQHVRSWLGFRDWFVSPASAVDVIDTTSIEPSTYLGALGMPGFTAWVAARKIAPLRSGEFVLVTAGAGAVGSIYAQLAKLAGCVVVASVGSDDNGRRLVDELGIDGWFNHRLGSFGELASTALPEGADLVLDNVGGAQLRDAIEVMRPHGRIVLCGSVSMYPAHASTVTFTPDQMIQLVARSLTLQGFVYPDFLSSALEYVEEMAALLASGAVRNAETTIAGLEHAVEAMLGLFTGTAHFGKLVIDLR